MCDMILYVYFAFFKVMDTTAISRTVIAILLDTNTAVVAPSLAIRATQ